MNNKLGMIKNRMDKIILKNIMINNLISSNLNNKLVNLKIRVRKSMRKRNLNNETY